MLGFETIGNATVIVHDDAPLLVTDPWLGGGAYFGSWTLSHPIPHEQRDAINRCRFVWVSHGHPDHLSGESLEQLTGRTLLLPDHVGSRMATDLAESGLTVRVLPNRRWVELSPRVKVMCVPDSYQDAILLVDVGGTLVANFNDARDHGWGPFVRRVTRGYKDSFLLMLSGHGDADMINFFDEDGTRLDPRLLQNPEPGAHVQSVAREFGIREVIPFSSFHRYQRRDSVWANDYVTPIAHCTLGARDPSIPIHEPFCRYDVTARRLTPLRPPEGEERVIPETEFGDDWSQPLDREDKARLAEYFRRKELLYDRFGFLRFVVGGDETVIDLNRDLGDAGITFEVPRHSLMESVRWEIFDDLLIGNYMRTTLHKVPSLYPGFTPVVAKFADNGRAQTRAEVDRYHAAYARQDTARYLADAVAGASSTLLRRVLPADSAVLAAARRVYYSARTLGR